jgi:MFS family permease
MSERRGRAQAMHGGTVGRGRGRARTAAVAAIAPRAAGHSRAGSRLAFLSAAVSLVTSLAAAAAPIPLYNIYRAEDGFTNPGISMAIVTYSLGTMVGLLMLGRLSNHLGRRVTAIASLGLLLLGCLLLLNVHHIGVLLAARTLMGVGTGLVSSSLTSYIVDAAPAKPEWLASAASSQGPMLGLTLGAVASGAMVQFGQWPRQLIFAVCAGFLLLSAALIAMSPETATPMPGAWRSLLPRVGVPVRVRPLLPAAGAIFIATWATGAFYQAFVPALIEDQLHTRSPLVLGLVFACYMAPSVLGAPFGGRLTAPQAQRVGMIVFLGGMNGAAAAIYNSSLAVFIVATIVAGVGQGIAVSAATRGLLKGSSVVDRAPIFSAIYLLCYGGAAILSLIAGGLSGTLSLPYIALGYGGLALIATLFTILRSPDLADDHPRSSVRSKARRTLTVRPNSADIARPGGRRACPDRPGG